MFVPSNYIPLALSGLWTSPSSFAQSKQTSMRSFFIGLLVLLFLAFAFFARWCFVCKIRKLCDDVPARAATLTLKDGDRTILKDYEQFAFPPSSFEPEMTPDNQLFLEKVAGHLRQNPEQNLTLTGRFLENEKTAKSGIYENLGIARAKAVERLLEKLGIDEDRISIDHEMAAGELLGEPISFVLYEPQPDEYEKLEYDFTDNTFSDANFSFGSAEFRPGEQCILYADSVKTFLDSHPEMVLTIIGHTDNKGTEKFNHDLGLRRAKNAETYFRELGVKSEIVTTSKGEALPIAPNTKPNGEDNPEGRQKNRRVNFKIDEKTLQ